MTPPTPADWTVLDAKPSPPGQPAAIVRRLGARVVDFAVWAAVLWVLNRAALVWMPGWQVAWTLVWLVLPLRFGGTLGKRLVRVRVVRTDGSALTLGRAVVREALVLGSIAIPIVGVLTALTAVNDPRRQALHDKAADTMAL